LFRIMIGVHLDEQIRALTGTGAAVEPFDSPPRSVVPLEAGFAGA
jgi:hypothetical protein